MKTTIFTSTGEEIPSWSHVIVNGFFANFKSWQTNIIKINKQHGVFHAGIMVLTEISCTASVVSHCRSSFEKTVLTCIDEKSAANGVTYCGA